jgi:catalase
MATIDQRFGRHPGYRALHAKGTICRARFKATPVASQLTRAKHMQSQAIEALVRFSNGNGPPALPDHADSPRGMATTFLLPDGGRTDILALTAPRFPARTAEGFIALLHATRPGPTMIPRVLLYLLRRPRALCPVLELIATSRPPSSYAACTYHALHAFRWVAPDGSHRHVRYRWVPEIVEAGIPSREARRRGPDYLQRDLDERLRRSPIRFTLKLQVAEPGDSVDDVSTVWPSGRQMIEAGLLEVTEVDTPPGPYSDRLVFDPTRLTDGIEATADPVLWFRTPVYELSATRRELRARPGGRSSGHDTRGSEEERTG